MEIGDLIKRIREANHFSQKRLALEVGMCNTSLSKIENNARIPSFGLMVRIARALRCSLDDFANGIEQECIIQITLIPVNSVKRNVSPDRKKAKPKQRR